MKNRDFVNFPTIHNCIWIVVNILIDRDKNLFYSEKFEKNVFYMSNKDPFFRYFVGGKIPTKLKQYIRNPNNSDNIFSKFKKPKKDNVIMYKDFTENQTSKFNFNKVEIIKRMKISKVTININDFEYSLCTCFDFFNRGYCVHLIYVLVILKIIAMPLNIKEKPKRGRKKKVLPALTKEKSETSSEEVMLFGKIFEFIKIIKILF